MCVFYLFKCVYVIPQLYSSFYVYQVAKKLNGADKILMAMGYQAPSNRSSRDVDELKIEGEVDLDHVANTAADLVILQCDLKLLKGNAKSIGSDYPSARITDVLEARSMNEQTYRNTYDEAVSRARCRLLHTSSPDRRSHRQDPRYYNSSNSGYNGSRYVEGGMEQERPHPAYVSTDNQKRPNTILPHSNAYPVENRNGTLLPRSVMEDQKSASKALNHRDSAPLLDSPAPKSDSLISPRRQLRRKSGSEGSLLDRVSITSSRPQGGEGSDSLKQHAIGSTAESYSYTVGSPNDLESSFSVISYSDNSTRPNPEDLPEPVFESEMAVVNNEYQRHLRYSRSDAPWFDSRASIYVDSKSPCSEDTYKPLEPLMPDPHHPGGYVDRTDTKSAYSDGTSKHLQPHPSGDVERVAARSAYSEDAVKHLHPGGYMDRGESHTSNGAQPGYHERASFGQTSPPKSPYTSGDRTSNRVSPDSST